MDNQTNPADGAGKTLIVPPADQLPRIVAADKEGLLAALAKKIDTFEQDVSTPLGRAAMKSLAFQVSTTKTALVRIAAGLTEEWRKSTAAVNAEKKIIETRMDALRDAVRQPLTDWENAEAKRVRDHEDALAALVKEPAWGRTETAAEIGTWVDHLQNLPERDWQEFAHRFEATLTRELARARAAHQGAIQREADAAELVRLRALAEEQEQQRKQQERVDREARIAAEAAEVARKEAEDKAARKAQEEREAAERRAREAQEALDRAERDRKDADERAQKALIDAERDRIRAREQAEANTRAAVEAERARVREEAEAKRAEDSRRAADIAHRKAINNGAVDAIVGLLVDIGTMKTFGETDVERRVAKAIVEKIARGEVPNVSINY